MKVKKILLGVMCILSTFLLTGCVKKTAITTEDFKSKTQNYSLISQDVSAQYAEHNDIVKEATVAMDTAGWQIEFYVLATATDAKNMYQTNYEKFSKTNDAANVTSEVNMMNYSTYSLTTTDSYKYISRVDNTLLYVDVNISAKEEVKAIVEALGY